jgi:hypothetical protein
MMRFVVVPAEIVAFGDSKLENFSVWDGDEGESFLERGLEMGRFIIRPSETPSPKTIKITFINLYLNIL